MRHMAIGSIKRLMSYNGKNRQRWCGVSHGSSIILPWAAGGILERLVATVAAAGGGGTTTQQSSRCTPTVRFLFRSQWVELFSTLTMMSSRPSMRSSTQGPLSSSASSCTHLLGCTHRHGKTSPNALELWSHLICDHYRASAEERKASIAHFFVSSHRKPPDAKGSKVRFGCDATMRGRAQQKGNRRASFMMLIDWRAAPTDNHRTFFPKCFHNLCTVPGERLVVGKTNCGDKKETKADGRIQKMCTRKRQLRKNMELGNNTLRWERAAEQNRRLLEKEPTLWDLSYRSYVSSLGPSFRPLHHSHLEVRQK